MSPTPSIKEFRKAFENPDKFRKYVVTFSAINPEQFEYPVMIKEEDATTNEAARLAKSFFYKEHPGMQVLEVNVKEVSE